MLLALDLDGTLLFEDGRLAHSEVELLQCLRRKGHIIALLTGRNLYSLKSVVPPNSPLDYVAYSTGAGLIEWPRGEIYYERNLSQEQSSALVALLLNSGVSYFALDSLPQNHYSYAVEGNNPPEDFFRRKSRYNDYLLQSPPRKASQFLIICSHDQQRESLIEQISERFSDISMVKATSPMDNQTPWLEIFPPEVHKGKALIYLKNRLGVTSSEILALGNDWNDQDMLLHAGKAYLVPKSPGELSAQFPTIEGPGKSPLENLINKEGLL